MKMSYRVPEVEYLRALAVMVVILDHLGILPAGFLGVDVFFVISGFVISKALHGSGRSSILSILKDFYYRRIIRIIPPLTVVTLASFAFAWFLFFDSDFARLQQRISQQSVFLQNVYFVETVTDYFRGIPATELTLHTWSLAVEEQFYLLYPLLFVLVFRAAPVGRAASATAMALLTAAAMYLAIFNRTALDDRTAGVLSHFLTGAIDPEAARFYSLSFRAWEFLLGWGAFALQPPLAALAHSNARVAGSRALIFVGMSLLFALTFMDVDAATWPNTYTVAACLVTAACLAATHVGADRTPPRNPLSTLLVYVGNTSYSAYLWHWPVLGYLVYTTADFGTHSIDYFIFFAVLGVLVAATYHSVEKHRFRISPAYSVVVLVGFIAGLYALGIVRRDHRWFGAEKQNIFATSQYDASDCQHYDADAVSRRFVVLFGDSHADAVRSEFQRVANDSSFDVVCLDGSRARLSTARSDAEQDLSRAVRADGYSGTLMVMRWNSYAFGYPDYEVEESGNRFLSWNTMRPRNALEAESFFKMNLAQLVQSMSTVPPRDIGLMLQVPQNPFFAHKEALIDFHNIRFRSLVPKTAAQYIDESARMRKVLADATAGLARFSVLDPGPFFCRGTSCAYRHGWNVLYKDDDHLSVYGETLLGPLFRQWLERVDRSVREDLPRRLNRPKSHT